MTTQPSDWAVARAFAEYRIVAHYSAVTMVQAVEARARELDASGDEPFELVVTGWTKADGKTLWLEHDGEPLFRFGKHDDLGANRAVHLYATPRAAEAGTTNSAQISSSLVVGDWLPIESAPKDGRAVILGHIGGKPYIGTWVHDTWLDERGLSRGPSHWRPLPPAPRAAMGAVGAGGGE